MRSNVPSIISAMAGISTRVSVPRKLGVRVCHRIRNEKRPSVPEFHNGRRLDGRGRLGSWQRGRCGVVNSDKMSIKVLPLGRQGVCGQSQFGGGEQAPLATWQSHDLTSFEELRGFAEYPQSSPQPFVWDQPKNSSRALCLFRMLFRGRLGLSGADRQEFLDQARRIVEFRPDPSRLVAQEFSSMAEL